MRVKATALGIVLATGVAGGGYAAAAGPAAAATIWDVAELRSLVLRTCHEEGLDAKLVDAVVQVESAYNPRAVSHKGAVGLMQLMPATARRLAVVDPFDPEQNVRGGVRELRRLVDQYAGDLVLALAAYNAGEGAVERHRGVPPYSETRDYVRRILSIYNGSPYQLLSATGRRPPVRLETDPSSGQTVISNVGSSAHRARGISISTGTAGVLGGGFGSSPR